MRDRQAFTRTVLPNGIMVYTYAVDSPVACLEIQLPTGAAHAHAKNGFIPGSVHFLEHMQNIRTSHFPEPHELDQELGMRGCHMNANTFRSKTSYWIDSPLHEISFATYALIDRVFRPFFHEADILTERKVVINERERDKFYPGRNQVSQYYNTEFMSDDPYPRKQLYGSDEDLAAITPRKLYDMHEKITSSSHIIAIAVGNSTFADLHSALSTIKTTDEMLDKKMADSHWVDPTFREVTFPTVTRPTLEMAWIHPRTTYSERLGIDFILGLLTNPVQGSLFKELRQKRGWTYGIRSSFTNHRQTIFGLSFPVNNREQIEHIRSTFFNRLEESITDQELVEREITRRLNNQVHHYQTTATIMAAASRELIGAKKIPTEREWQKEIKSMTSLSSRRKIVQRFFTRTAMGEIAFMPTES